jgi:hypothetical protein
MICGCVLAQAHAVELDGHRPLSGPVQPRPPAFQKLMLALDTPQKKLEPPDPKTPPKQKTPIHFQHNA